MNEIHPSSLTKTKARWSLLKKNNFEVTKQNEHVTRNEKIAAEILDCTDLDEALNDILFWEETINRLDGEKVDLLRENKSLKAEVELLQTSNESDKKNISCLQDSVKALQDTMQKRLDGEVEIKSLREQLIECQNRADEADKKLLCEIEKFEELTKLQQRNHEEHLQKETQKINKDYTDKRKEYEVEINRLQLLLEDQYNRQQELEMKHENDIVKMQMEYESKIAMMQVQNSRLQSTSNSSNSVSNEVFRKKLQHIQEEASREINQLKQELSSLRALYNAGCDGKDIPSSAYSRRPGILKRKRM